MTLDTAVLADLAAKATPGPWVQGAFVDGPEYAHMSRPWKQAREAEERRLVRARDVKGDHVAVAQDPFGRAEADAALIVAAVNGLPTLLAEVESLRKALTEIVDLPTVVPDHGHGGVNPPYLEWHRVAAIARAALVSKEGSR